MVAYVTNVARIEFLHHSRRWGWRLLLVLSYCFPFMAIPPEGGSRIILAMGRQDSIFIGVATIYLAAIILGIVSFYFFVDSLPRDRRTIAPFLSSSPISGKSYILGKLLGMMLSLFPLLIAMVLGKLHLFFLRGVGNLNLWYLWGPLIPLTLAMLVWIAGLVLFLGCLGVKGPAPRIVFGFLWIFVLIASIYRYAPDAGNWFLLFMDVIDYQGQGAIYDFLLIENSVEGIIGLGGGGRFAEITRESLPPLQPWAFSTFFSWQRLWIFGAGTIMIVLSAKIFDRFQK